MGIYGTSVPLTAFDITPDTDEDEVELELCEECGEEFYPTADYQYRCEDCQYVECPRCETQVEYDTLGIPEEYYGGMAPVCEECRERFTEILDQFRAEAVEVWEESQD